MIWTSLPELDPFGHDIESFLYIAELFLFATVLLSNFSLIREY